MQQTLKNVWTWIRKYSGLLIGLLLAILTAVAFGRKNTNPPVIPTDANRDGRDDQQQIEELQEQAAVHREAAEVNVNAAQEAVQRPVVVSPSRDVEDAVRRNNEVDY